VSARYRGGGEVKTNDEITLDNINQLYEYLQGKLPDCVSKSVFTPKLSPKHAFEIIWFLQEVTGCLPDKYERCSICGTIYNSDEGDYSDLTGKCYCSCCLEQSGIINCEDCGKDVYELKAWSKKYEKYLCRDCKKKRKQGAEREKGG
jgi:hypothetical protein